MTIPDDDGPAASHDGTEGQAGACPTSTRSRLWRLLAGVVFVAACLLVLRELGVVEASFGRIASRVATTANTSHAFSPRPEGPATVVLRGQVDAAGAAVDVLLERLNTNYDHMFDKSRVAGQVDVHVTQLAVAGNAWIPVKKAIHVDFAMTVKTRLARAELQNGRSSETILSGTIDIEAEGLHSYRAVQRAIGEKIAAVAIGLVRKEIVDLAKPLLPEVK